MTRKELYNTDKKIRYKLWPKNEYVYFCEIKDNWFNEKGDKITPNFYNPTDWEYFVKPKNKKRIIFYEYVVESVLGNETEPTLRLIWSEVHPSKVKHKHTGQSKTVEIDQNVR